MYKIIFCVRRWTFLLSFLLFPLWCFSGILLAMTSIGPAFGFISGAVMLRIYVDFDKTPKGRNHSTEPKPCMLQFYFTFKGNGKTSCMLVNN